MVRGAFALALAVSLTCCSTQAPTGPVLDVATIKPRMPVGYCFLVTANGREMPIMYQGEVGGRFKFETPPPLPLFAFDFNWDGLVSVEYPGGSVTFAPDDGSMNAQLAVGMKWTRKFDYQYGGHSLPCESRGAVRSYLPEHFAAGTFNAYLIQDSMSCLGGYLAAERTIYLAPDALFPLMRVQTSSASTAGAQGDLRSWPLVPLNYEVKKFPPIIAERTKGRPT